MGGLRQANGEVLDSPFADFAVAQDGEPIEMLELRVPLSALLCRLTDACRDAGALQPVHLHVGVEGSGPIREILLEGSWCLQRAANVAKRALWAHAVLPASVHNASYSTVVVHAIAIQRPVPAPADCGPLQGNAPWGAAGV